ncbi:N-formylglutamate amidohydrolase [Dongia soli]|uniref:N-formylglutamate amidohydrolase n=1 Tax=Dongia soli TaxID=600628 RepID=A0ABU5EGD2_9PROT|nr:N-formylglutamate amidohydrolase [Dongia soli]MDY0884919.1 N-formylglutamate amidohydrolase [Dongia soli]
MSGDFNASDDAPAKPFEMIWPSRQTAPLLLASPHSGRHYPAAFLAQAILDRQVLRQSEDCYVDLLIEAGPRLGVPCLRALFPRIFVDPNRDAAELDPSMFLEALPAPVQAATPRVMAGLGVIPKLAANEREIYGRQLSYREAVERLEKYYRPYHRALAEAIRHIRAEFGHCLLLDCHSMPSGGAPLVTAMHGIDPAAGTVPAIGLTPGIARAPGPVDSGRNEVDFILGDCYGGSCADAVTAMTETFLTRAGARVRRNNPYSGGYVTQRYGRPAEGVHVLQLEINRRLYVDEANLTPTAGFAATKDLLSGLIGALRDAAADLMRRR